MEFQKRSNGRINFKFTDKQQERFSLLYAETQKVYPHLTSCDVEKERVKVILAYYVINEDLKTTETTQEFKELEI